jgi:hypothetical protein
MDINTNSIATKKLLIKGKYEGFKDFYDVNKIVIYKNILKLFTNFKKQDKDQLVLIISAKISNLDWETELKFQRKESIVLVRDIMPYFEQIEDYETCGQICDLYKKIQSV